MSSNEHLVLRCLRWQFLAGWILGIIFPLLLAEALVRAHPPVDLHEYLGESSPLTGMYQPDPVLGADYKSYDDFQRTYHSRLEELGPLESPQPTWAWFGNSFVQAPGMLGDTSAADLPGMRMFYLKQNEPPFLRIAQARALLKNGLKPKRLIFALLPVDMHILGRQPLSSIHVTSRGAITYRLRYPEGLPGSVVKLSRLAMLLWVRSGYHVAQPTFRDQDITSSVPSWLRADLQTFIRLLAGMEQDDGPRVTVLLIPNRKQVFGKAGFALQDAIATMCREAEIDYFDPRNVFLQAVEKSTLFLPDWHFSERGNRLLYAALQAHFAAGKPAEKPERK